MSVLARKLMAASTAAFSPSDLFAASEVGAWYDPSDLSTMFTDTAGTTPVTTDGDLVARINDKSGNGYHATQGTSGKCPVYKTAAGKHWLRFDGTDDNLGTSLDTNTVFGGSTDTDFFFTVAAQLVSVGTDSGTPYLNDAVFSDTQGYIGLYARSSGVLIFYQWDTTERNATHSCTITDKFIASGSRSDSGNTNYLRYNGADVANVSMPAAMDTIASTLTIGRGGGSDSLTANVDFYGMIIRKGTYTAGNITDFETWINAKIGAY